MFITIWALVVNTQIFDISNACLGFLNAMILASSVIQNAQIQRAMIVAGEKWPAAC